MFCWNATAKRRWVIGMEPRRCVDELAGENIPLTYEGKPIASACARLINLGPCSPLSMRERVDDGKRNKRSGSRGMEVI